MCQARNPKVAPLHPTARESLTLQRLRQSQSIVFRLGRRFFGVVDAFLAIVCFLAFCLRDQQNEKSQKLIDRILAGVDEQCGPFGIELQHLTARVLAGITVCLFLAFL